MSESNKNAEIITFDDDDKKEKRKVIKNINRELLNFSEYISKKYGWQFSDGGVLNIVKDISVTHLSNTCIAIGARDAVLVSAVAEKFYRDIKKQLDAFMHVD